MLALAIASVLFAIGVGAAFLIWSYRNEGKCIGFAKVVGYFILIVGILTFACVGLKGAKMMSGSSYMVGNPSVSQPAPTPTPGGPGK